MKKIICAVSVVVMSIASIAIFGSSTTSAISEEPVRVDVSCQGKNCTGTVGCDCPGFSPITNGDVCDQAYCKHCKHHRRSHR